jgi:hypothetical protein
MDALTNSVVQAAMEALVNLWFGVGKAGYSVKDEAPVALAEFAVPNIAAIPIWGNRHNGDG